MKILSNELVGQYASPDNHPITCANPAPWLITECKIRVNPLKVMIRGEESMWFSATDCTIGEKWGLEHWLIYQSIQESIKVRTYLAIGE